MKYITGLFWGLIILVFTFNPCASLANPDTLIVAYAPAPPFVIEKDGKLEGINVWLWKQVAKQNDTEYIFKKMDFSEMLYALESGEVDISINPLTITSERSKKMEFTHSYYASHSTVVTYETSLFNKTLQSLKAIFNMSFMRVLLILFITVFIFGLFMWLVERKTNPHQFRKGIKGIWDGLYWSVVTMTTVGYGDKTPKSRSGKIIALVWMFSGLLFISGLTAFEASMLTVNQLKSNPKGFFEFKNEKVGCITNTSTNEFLEEHFFNNIVTYASVQEGLTDLKQKNIKAFLYDEPILRYKINQNKDFQNLTLLPIEFDLQFYAFGLSKENKNIEADISQRILELTESLKWRAILNEYNLSEI